MRQILRECPPPAGAIFESNSVLRCLRPDLCLAAASSLKGEHKPSYELVEQRMDAMVELAGHDHIIEAEKITFRLASMERVSPTMQEWLRERLRGRRGQFGLLGADTRGRIRLHRSQTHSPTRTILSGMCTGGPSPQRPHIILAAQPIRDIHRRVPGSLTSGSHACNVGHIPSICL